MRVLVIGGTRSIGPRLVRRLVSAGHEVTVFHRGQATFGKRWRRNGNTCQKCL